MSALPLIALIVSIGLVFVLGARMFAGTRFGLVAALVFASTPLLWRLAWAAPAALFPLPFVLGWLVAATHVTDARGTAWAAVSGACLGVGVYTSTAAIVMMPVYLLLTLVVFAHAGVASRAQAVAFVGAFAVACVPFGWTLLRNPEAYRDAIVRHHLYDAHQYNVLQGMREMTSWTGLTARSEVYRDYLNPAFLFVTGGVPVLAGGGASPRGVLSRGGDSSPRPSRGWSWPDFSWRRSRER